MCLTLCSHHFFSFNRSQSSTQHSSDRFPLLILQTTIMQSTPIIRAEHTFPHTNTLFTTQRLELIRIFALSTIVRLHSKIKSSVWRFQFRILDQLTPMQFKWNVIMSIHELIEIFIIFDEWVSHFKLGLEINPAHWSRLKFIVFWYQIANFCRKIKISHGNCHGSYIETS